MTVTAPGLRAAQVKDIAIDVAERRLLRVALTLAGTSETVEVRADAPVLQGEEASDK